MDNYIIEIVFGSIFLWQMIKYAIRLSKNRLYGIMMWIIGDVILLAMNSVLMFRGINNYFPYAIMIVISFMTTTILSAISIYLAVDRGHFMFAKTAPLIKRELQTSWILFFTVATSVSSIFIGINVSMPYQMITEFDTVCMLASLATAVLVGINNGIIKLISK